MSIRLLASLAMVVGLAGGASCADDPELDPTPSAPGERDCQPVAAELDRLDRALETCAADADCPCGSRCTSVGVCTYDCRPERLDACGDGQTCDVRGRCHGATEVTP